MKDELAARGGCINALLQRAEPDIPCIEVGDDVDEVAERPAKAVEAPNNQTVPRSRERQCFGQARSVSFGPRRVVSEDSLAARMGESIRLEVDRLVGC